MYWLFYSNPLLRLNFVDIFCCHKLNPCWLNANFTLLQCKFLAQFMLISLFCQIHLCLCNQLIYCSCLLAKIAVVSIFIQHTVYIKRFNFKMLKNQKYFYIPTKYHWKIHCTTVLCISRIVLIYGSLLWFIFTVNFIETSIESKHVDNKYFKCFFLNSSSIP